VIADDSTRRRKHTGANVADPSANEIVDPPTGEIPTSAG